MINEAFLDIKNTYGSSPIWLRRYYWGCSCFIFACFFWWYLPCVSYFGFAQLSDYFSFIDKIYSPSLWLAAIAIIFSGTNFYFHKNKMFGRILLFRKLMIWLIVFVSAYLANGYYSSWKENKESREDARSTLETAIKLAKQFNLKNEMSFDLAVVQIQMQEKFGSEWGDKSSPFRSFDESKLPKLNVIDVMAAPAFLFSKYEMSRADYLYLSRHSAQTAPGIAFLLYVLGLICFYSGARLAGFFVRAE